MSAPPGSVQGRSDYLEAVQCPCCHLYFGIYIESPMDPTMSVKVATVGPKDSKEVHRKLIEQWKKQGTLTRVNSVPVPGKGTTH